MHSHDIAAGCPPTCPLHDPAAYHCPCGCGGTPILADVEDWSYPLCYEAWVALGQPTQEPSWNDALRITRIVAVAKGDRS
jgi:hypothetical protein